MVPDNGHSSAVAVGTTASSTSTSATQTSIEMTTTSPSEVAAGVATMTTTTPASSVTITSAEGGGNLSAHSHQQSRNYRRQQSRSPSAAVQMPSSRGVSSSSSASSASSTSAHDYLYFDSNTFKQVKRLYCGMLLVAVAYSLTMIVMMVFLYKTLPHPGMAGGSAIGGVGGNLVSPPSSSFSASTVSPVNTGGFNSKLFQELAVDPHDSMHIFASQSKSAYQRGNSGNGLPIADVAAAEPVAAASAAAAATTGGGLFRSHDGRLAISHETARTYLDQVIAINFLTLILYSLAFYAAHRELYTLTLAFTSTLSFTMMFSVVKIFVEGVHFPNNFMSLLLRVSIVFVALVYLGQLRRKQHFVRSLWLSPSSLLHHPALRGSQMTPNQTAQLIRDFLAASSAAAVASGSSAGGLTLGLSHLATFGKTDEEGLPEYQDMPPNYEEALRCPVPTEGGSLPTSSATLSTSASSAANSSSSPTTTTTSSAASTSVLIGNSDAVSLSAASTRAASQLTLGPPPPAFDELRASQTSLASANTADLQQQQQPSVSITVPEMTTKEA